MVSELWPYCFCTGCNKLAPILIEGKRYTCIICNTMIERKNRFKVMLDNEEARYRKLAFPRTGAD